MRLVRLAMCNGLEYAGEGRLCRPHCPIGGRRLRSPCGRERLCRSYVTINDSVVSVLEVSGICVGRQRNPCWKSVESVLEVSALYKVNAVTTIAHIMHVNKEKRVNLCAVILIHYLCTGALRQAAPRPHGSKRKQFLCSRRA